MKLENSPSSKNHKASVLAVSLIIMGIMIIIALGISSSSLQSRKSSIGSSNSNVAFQNADSGLEIVMKQIKDNPGGIVSDITGPGVCSNGTFVEAGKYKIELKKADGSPVACSDLISLIDKVKSTGYSNQDSRAIEATVGSAAIVCTGNGKFIATGNILAGHWKLDEGSGTTANDSSSRRNDGTLYGNPNWLTGSIDFDGVDDYIQTAGNNMYDDFSAGTLIVWALNLSGIRDYEIDGIPYGENTLASYATLENGFSVIEWDAQLLPGGFRLQQAWKTQNGPTDWNRIRTTDPIAVDNACHMIAFVADGTTTKIYYDGILQKTEYRPDSPGFGSEAEFISSIRDVSLFNHRFNIGAMIRGYTSRFFKGTIGEVQIYNRPLSAPEIGTLK